MIKLKMRHIRCLIFILITVNGVNAAGATVYCSWWKYVDGEGFFPLQHEAVCIKEVGPEETPTVYVVPDFNDMCVTKSPGSNGLYSGCVCGTEECGDPIKSFWYDAASGGALGGIRGVYLPLKDAYFPFILLTGIYGTIIYRRRNQQTKDRVI